MIHLDIRQATSIPTAVRTAIPSGVATAVPSNVQVPSNVASLIPSAAATYIPSGVTNIINGIVASTKLPAGVPTPSAVTNAMNTVNDVKTTFTSWDKCMQKAYCKWPVICAIVVGTLIAVGIIWCIARCICCGAECVCCCFRCCGSSKKKGGYNQHDRPGYPAPQPYPYNAQYASHGAPRYEAPQFATFDSSKPIHEDSLPAMPSWENASSKKVEVVEEQESHEMNNLGANGKDSAAVPMLANAQKSPMDSPALNTPGQNTPGMHSPATHLGAGGYNAASSQVGYGFPNQSTGNFSNTDSHRGAPSPLPSSYNRGTPQGYSGGQLHPGGSGFGRQESYGNNGYNSPRSPASPLYSGSTAHDSYSNQGYDNHSSSNQRSYGNHDGFQQSHYQADPYSQGGGRRGPSNTWRDV